MKSYSKEYRARYYKEIGVANAEEALALRRTPEAKQLSAQVLAMTAWKPLPLRTVHMISDKAHKHLFSLWEKEHKVEVPMVILEAEEVYDEPKDKLLASYI